MEADRRFNPAKNGADFFLIVAILALCMVAVRHAMSRLGPEEPAVPQANSAAGLDILWRDAVKPMKERKALRPKKDSSIIGDDGASQTQTAQVYPPAQEEPSMPAQVEETPPWREPPAPAARPRLEKMGWSFGGNEDHAKTSAFLPDPSRAQQKPPESRPAAQAPKSAAQAPAEERRPWRRVNSR
jgi:hypothetical protein